MASMQGQLLGGRATTYLATMFTHGADLVCGLDTDASRSFFISASCKPPARRIRVQHVLAAGCAPASIELARSC